MPMPEAATLYSAKTVGLLMAYALELRQYPARGIREEPYLDIILDSHLQGVWTYDIGDHARALFQQYGGHDIGNLIAELRRGRAMHDREAFDGASAAAFDPSKTIVPALCA